MDGQGENFAVNSEAALVCHHGLQEQPALKTALAELGYRVDVAEHTQEAISKIPLTGYRVIVLDEKFDGSTLENNELLKHLQTMLMSTRRSITLALVGSTFTTGDHMTAFAKSVNVVVNPNDMTKIAPILKRAIAERDDFFHTLETALQEAGMSG